MGRSKLLLTLGVLVTVLVTVVVIALGGWNFGGTGSSDPGPARDSPTKARQGYPDPEVDEKWTQIDASTDAFASACAEQWFVSRQGKEVVAVEKRTAELQEVGKSREWVFHTEAWTRAKDGAIQRARYRLLARHDRDLTPIEGKLEAWYGPESRGKILWRYHNGQFEQRVMEFGTTPPFNRQAATPDGWENVVVDGPIRKALVVDWSIQRVLERATIAGIARVERSLLLFVENGRRVYEAAFVAGPVTTRDGKRLRTWKQENRTGPFDADEELDISPDSGLVARRRPDSMDTWLNSRVTLTTASTEDECRATGLVPR